MTKTTTPDKPARAPRKAKAAPAPETAAAAEAPFDADPAPEVAHELVELDPKKQALAVFKPQLALVEEFKKRFGPDVVVQYETREEGGRLTTKGSEAARADRLLLVTARTTIDKKRKALNEADQDRIAKRNEVAKSITAELAPFEDTVDALIKADEKKAADEKAEQERLKREREEAVAARLNAIQNRLISTFGKTAAEIAASEAELRAQELTPDDYGVRFGEAVAAKDHVLAKLAEAHAKTLVLEERERAAAEAEARRKEEEAAAEAKRLAAEQEERDRQARLAKENEERAAAIAKQEEELAAKRRAFEAEQEAARLAKQKAEDEERAERQRKEDQARAARQARLDAIESMRGIYARALASDNVSDVDIYIEGMTTLQVDAEHFADLLPEAQAAHGATANKLKELRAHLVERDRKAEEQRKADEAAAAERKRLDEEARAKREKEESEARALLTKQAAEAARARAQLARAQQAGPRMLGVLKHILEACDTLVGEALAERIEALTPSIRAAVADGELPTLTEEAAQA